MAWSANPSTDIVVITERETQERMRTLLEQLRRLGYGVHLLPRASAQQLSRVPVPQVVIVDVASREYQSTNATPPAVQAAWEGVPIILAVDSEEASGLYFEAGVHDFITLPVANIELETRMRFTLWKTQGTRNSSHEQLQLDGLRMNLATYEVWVDNKRIDLTYKEFELLKFFVSHRRRVFTRPELLEEVWESDYYGGTRTVDVHIRRLRSKLGHRVGNMIQTVRNVGYRFG